MYITLPEKETQHYKARAVPIKNARETPGVFHANVYRDGFGSFYR
jgi:hypothetical protein